VRPLTAAVIVAPLHHRRARSCSHGGQGLTALPYPPAMHAQDPQQIWLRQVRIFPYSGISDRCTCSIDAHAPAAEFMVQGKMVLPQNHFVQNELPQFIFIV
ncbi:MAG: hypothetical protein NTV22_00255, partial [bacterium]|nr:hypothetical protein [bacterium]